MKGTSKRVEREVVQTIHETEFNLTLTHKEACSLKTILLSMPGTSERYESFRGSLVDVLNDMSVFVPTHEGKIPPPNRRYTRHG